MLWQSIASSHQSPPRFPHGRQVGSTVGRTCLEDLTSVAVRVLPSRGPGPRERSSRSLVRGTWLQVRPRPAWSSPPAPRVTWLVTWSTAGALAFYLSVKGDPVSTTHVGVLLISFYFTALLVD